MVHTINSHLDSEDYESLKHCEVCFPSTAPLYNQIDSIKADLSRANLRIIAKDMQIAELTRMLFALGKQDGQTIRELTEENRGLRQMLHMEAK